MSSRKFRNDQKNNSFPDKKLNPTLDNTKDSNDLDEMPDFNEPDLGNEEDMWSAAAETSENKSAEQTPPLLTTEDMFKDIDY